jgi:mono/diheme cytochrome c family protein
MVRAKLSKLLGLAGAAYIPLLCSIACAQDVTAGDTMSRGRVFAEQGGAALYANSCAACHMPDGRGAAGAARYPALADNPNLAMPDYPITVILQGLRAMPAFGPMLTDVQAADIVNYVRTHFGNHYDEKASAADVHALRGSIR